MNLVTDCASLDDDVECCMCLICCLTFIAHTSVHYFKTVYVAVMKGGAAQKNSDAEMEKVLAGCLVTSRGCNGVSQVPRCNQDGTVAVANLDGQHVATDQV